MCAEVSITNKQANKQAKQNNREKTKKNNQNSLRQTFNDKVGCRCVGPQWRT